MNVRIFFAVCIILFAYSANSQAQNTFTEHSVLSSGEWYRISIANDGVYKINVADIATLKGAQCDQIAIYGGTGNQLNEAKNGYHPDDLDPIAIHIADINDNGSFDAEDYILFYAEGPNVWRCNSTGRFEYKVNPYANYNCYFLTTNLAQPSSHNRIATTDLAPTDETIITEYTAAVVRNIDNLNTHGGGQIWVEDKFTPGMNSRNYALSLPATPINQQAIARIGLGHTPDHSGRFIIRYGTDSYDDYFNNAITYRATSHTLDVLSKDLTFSISYTPSNSNSEGYFDFIELNAQVPFTYNGGSITAHNVSHLGEGQRHTFKVTGSGYGTLVWDISNPLQPTQPTITGAGNNQFQFVTDCRTAGSYIIFAPAEVQHPQHITPIANQDLHHAQLPDFVIVAHSDFLSQAEKLADIHRQAEGLNVLVTSQDAVFNEFSSGKPDPIAMRQLMLCLRSKDSLGANPRYLLFFGKGTYDNRDILNHNTRSVVTYQSYTSFDSEGAAYPTDDVAGYLDVSRPGLFEGEMSVGIGRLPANSSIEADHYVNKIEGYMTRRDFDDPTIRGDWRNYVVLLADDADPSSPHDSVFASDSEKTARRIKEQFPQFNIDRIYADAYTQQSGADGSYYPDVNNALRQRMNYGCLLLNYIGHGSSSYIGTERFVEFSDIEKYTNFNRLPFFVTSTCSYGHYDFPDDICGSEAFLRAEAAGIGVIAAARPIHHNQTFNTNVCLFALDPNNTVGDALRKAKNATQSPHCITLIGDPALHLSLPRNEVVVTAINDRPVDPEVTDSAEVLSRVTIQGEIRNNQGNLLPDFNGTIYPIVFDREVACRTLANDNDSTEVNFVQQKNMLYKGSGTVVNGQFSYSFIVPRDVAYRYDYAKLSHYAQSATDNATGQYSNIMFGGFNEDMEISELHPTVQLYIGDTNFRNGAITNESPTLFARLIDSVGINAAGSGLGHDITAIIDGNPYSTVTLNDYYEPDINDSRNGTLYYTLGKLDDGPHTLTVKCWNIFNYSGSKTISFVVANDRTPQIGQLTAAPNPAHDRTTLRLEHNLPGAIAHATFDIYDTRGRLVRQFSVSNPSGECIIALPWDFTTETGSPAPRGIYILRATATTTDGQQLMQTAKIVRY